MSTPTALHINSETAIERYFQELELLCQRLPRQPITDAVETIYHAWQRGSAVYIIGNGGSASTATHFACDLAKSTIIAGKKRLRAISLVDNVPLVSAWTNDSGFRSVFAEQLEPWIQEGDVLIAISVHGGSGQGDAGPWSQNLPQAVALAQSRGAKVIGLSGFGGGALAELADVCMVVPVDGETLGTPLVESVHVALHHFICLGLKLRIMEEADA